MSVIEEGDEKKVAAPLEDGLRGLGLADLGDDLEDGRPIAPSAKPHPWEISMGMVVWLAICF